MVEQINKSYILYNDNHVIHTREYYNYIVGLFKTWLGNKDIGINVILGNQTMGFNNNNKTIRIDIQCEHTLVMDGGRSVGERVYGNVKHQNGNYLVRIDKYDYFNSLDVIIEYSLPNMFNISSSGKFDSYYSKNIYIAPTLYDENFSSVDKTDIITLFTRSGNQRRLNILNEMDKLNIPNNTIEGCFSNDCILDLYRKSKILVNVHQTDHHHTFEELRVLPALLNGVIIVSEDVPLKETIKYSEYIVWADYGDIANKTLEVMNDYSNYHNKLFGDGKISVILDDLKKNNLESINRLKI
jgi:hypothetical protein